MKTCISLQPPLQSNLNLLNPLTHSIMVQHDSVNRQQNTDQPATELLLSAFVILVLQLNKRQHDKFTLFIESSRNRRKSIRPRDIR